MLATLRTNDRLSGAIARRGETRDDRPMGEEIRVQELMCARCNMVTAHALTAIEPGKSSARCQRCVEIETRAVQLVEQRAQDKRSKASLAAMAAGGIVAGGALLPWVEVAGPFGQTISKAGIDGDGMITALLGGILLAAGASGRHASVGFRVAWALSAVLILIIAGNDISNLLSARRGDEEVRLAIKIGIGLWATIAGGSIGLASAGMGNK